jgi:hypothetical protein
VATGPEIAQMAKKQLSELTGLKPDTVAALTRDQEGWHVTVILLEVTYVPDTLDLLATYEVLLDDEGNLISYQRTTRYRRNQILAET